MNTADEITRNQETYDAEIARIRADRDLTPAAKASRMQAAYGKAFARYTELTARARAAVEAESEALYRQAFAPTFTSPYPDESLEVLVRMSYRDALSRAAAADKSKPDELRDLRRRAQVTGDTLLERATVAIAYERGDRVVLQEAAEHDPNVRRLVEASVSDKRDQVEANVANSLRAPRLPAEARTDPAMRAA